MNFKEYFDSLGKGEVVQLARKLHVSRQTIYNYAEGNTKPQLKTVFRIEDLTGVPVGSWRSEDEEETETLDLI